MKRRLLWINLLLIVLASFGGWRLRQNWLDARAREQRMFGRSPRPASVSPLPPFAQAPAVTAGSYFEVVEKMLFSRDRNPIVVVEATPPKPMPPLPFFHGAMDLGDGPTILLSEKSGGDHKGYHVGDQIGEFKIAALGDDEIDFEWDGKRIKKRFEELVDKNAKDLTANLSAPAQPRQVAAAAQAPAPAPSGSAVLGGTVKPGPAPGKGGDIRPCQAGDDSPAGTVVDGYKKLINKTPFGTVCRWQLVQ